MNLAESIAKAYPAADALLQGTTPPSRNVQRHVKRVLVLLAALVAACGGAGTTTTGAGLSLVNNWELLEGTVDGVPIPEGDFRITLLMENGTVGGVAACNSYGGQYTADDAFLSFGLMGQTEMACAEPAMSAESTFLNALSRVESYVVAAEQLTLSGEDVSLVFAAIPPIETAPLFEQRWVLESLVQGEAVSSVQGYGFLLLTEGGAFSGSTGCRNVDGIFIVVADEIVPTSFGAEGECPPEMGQQDSHFISVIEGGFSTSVKEDRLTLMDPDGNGLQFRAEG
jgi:heat shock protein HslJ